MDGGSLLLNSFPSQWSLSEKIRSSILEILNLGCSSGDVEIFELNQSLEDQGPSSVREVGSEQQEIMMNVAGEARKHIECRVQTPKRIKCFKKESQTLLSDEHDRPGT